MKLSTTTLLMRIVLIVNALRKEKGNHKKDHANSISVRHDLKLTNSPVILLRQFLLLAPAVVKGLTIQICDLAHIFLPSIKWSG